MHDLHAYFLVGPTASGKSAVAQCLAERLDWDILSADSMLVYKGMDIGTAKPTPGERGGVRYHGMDLSAPDQAFSVGAYRRHVLGVLARNHDQGRKTLVCGGTGLYVKSLTDGLAPGPPPDAAARARWTAVFEAGGVPALQAALRERSPAVYTSLADPDNGRRLIRCLELAESGSRELPRTWRVEHVGAPLAGLHVPPEELKTRIESRVTEMYRLGFVAEVERLRADYPRMSDTAGQAIGYAEILAILDGRCTEAEARVRTLVRTRQLAKRQRTWFRNQATVHWVDARGERGVEAIADDVLAHWRRHGPTPIQGEQPS